MKLSLSTIVFANVALVIAFGCLLSMGPSSQQLGAPVATRAAMSTSFAARTMSPAPTFRSAIANAYCEEVVDPANNLKYETMSYTNVFTEQDIAAQINYMIQNGLIPCVEFDKGGQIFREHSRMPGYYDGRYWTMWKLPMFGATDAGAVMREIAECKQNNPDSFIRVLGFDNIKQVQCMGFLASRPGKAFNSASAPSYGQQQSYGGYQQPPNSGPAPGYGQQSWASPQQAQQQGGGGYQAPPSSGSKGFTYSW
mmetsp:Transcript_8885/g.14412  ORF Transcript_8885/g.14412 Transcript_8885/m.14412 type:complete len:253 (+) Transcript_8885:28-786(+)